MSEFTPGPWKVHPIQKLAVHQPEYECWIPQNEADARLIAAAPELYRECQNAKARLESVLANEEAAKAFNNANLDELLSLEIRMAIETIEAALKKARGE
jgi:hypothetical protein